MDKKIIFVKTPKGDSELKSKTGHLFGDVKRVLVLVDNKSTVEELTKRAAPSLRTSFDEILQELVDGGYIQEKDKASAPKAAATPASPKASSLKMAMPGAKPQDSGEELDFTSILPKITPQALAAEAAKVKTQTPPPSVVQKTTAASETQKETEARQEAEARRHAEIETARMQAGQEEARKKAKLAAEQAKAKAQAGANALTDVEAARIKAENEAARVKAEQAAAVAREKAEAEAKARAEAEAARLKVEQEAARIKAELAAAQAKAQAESQARAEAEAARLKAEREAAKAKAEAEKAAAEAKIEAEMKALALAKAQAEAQAQAEEQARARLKAEQEALAERQREEKAQQLKAEQAAAQAQQKAQAEEKAKAEAEALARQTEKSAAPISQAVVTKLQQDKALKAKAEEEARQLAESQAKKWAEAEERAKAQAQQAETAQQVSHKPEKTTPAKTIVRASKAPRQSLPLGKITAVLLVLAVILAFALPYVWPMQEYITQIERSLAAQLKQPVKIGHMRPALLPLPKLELKNVVIGNDRELQADAVTLNFSIAALVSETRTINRAEITGLAIKAESFSKALPGIQAAAAIANFPVNQMVIHKARISGGDLNFPALSGDIYFDGKGNLIKSVLGSEDGKFTLQLQPQQSRWQISAVVKENSLPLLPGVVFSEVNVKGEILANEANFSVIEGMLYKGKILGSARLTWKDGWQLQGQLDMKALALQDIWPQSGLNGDLNGRASVILRASNPAQLGKAPRIEGDFSVKKGFINGIDMVETARVARRQGVSAGRTHFDDLNGTVLADGSNIQLRQIKISAGILTGNGFVDVTSGQQLSGRVNVDLKIRADKGSMPLILSGTLEQPVWRTGP